MLWTYILTAETLEYRSFDLIAELRIFQSREYLRYVSQRVKQNNSEKSFLSSFPVGFFIPFVSNS